MGKQKKEKPEEIRQRLIDLLNEGPLLPGSIRKQWNVCGMPGCRCKDSDDPRKHGPYFQLSFTLAGKSSSMFVKEEEFEHIMVVTQRYRRFKALCLVLVQSYVAEERSKRKQRKRSSKQLTDVEERYE
jgi:hypothetical protein